MCCGPFHLDTGKRPGAPAHEPQAPKWSQPAQRARAQTSLIAGNHRERAQGAADAFSQFEELPRVALKAQNPNEVNNWMS